MNRKDIRHLDKKRLAALFDFAESERESDAQAADAPSVMPEADRSLDDAESTGVDANSTGEGDPPPSPTTPG
jgi:hypothetical protein